MTYRIRDQQQRIMVASQTSGLLTELDRAHRRIHDGVIDADKTVESLIRICADDQRTRKFFFDPVHTENVILIRNDVTMWFPREHNTERENEFGVIYKYPHVLPDSTTPVYIACRFDRAVLYLTQQELPEWYSKAISINDVVNAE